MMNSAHANLNTPDINPALYPVRIYTLGRFSLVVNDSPVRFTGKAQKRPLELLKAVVALGGRQISCQRIGELLWPDAEGDAIHTNLHTTLHRLRKLIGAQALLMQNGQLSLNDQYCWSDVVNFEKQLSALDKLLTEPTLATTQLMSFLQQTAGLYQGPFLGSECDYPWAMTLRESLRARWLRTLRQCIARLGAAGECQAVQSWYHQGINTNELAEEFYRGLISCLGAHGHRAEAIAVYERCRMVLKQHLDIDPSSKTMSVYQAIKCGDDNLFSQLCGQCRHAKSSTTPATNNQHRTEQEKFSSSL